MSPKNVLISIIVPVYNLENKNLTRCISSILAQTFTNFELLLINDGSTDKSRSICESYAANDNRIQIINKENQGVSSARNLGIEKSRGEYLVFIDGDDYVDNDYLEHFIKLLPADLILQSVADFCYDLDKAKTQYHFKDKDYGNNFLELFSQYNIYKFGAPWARLFKSEIIKVHNLKFDTNIHFREDELFFLQYLSNCKRIKTDSYFGYHYMYYPTSSSRRYYGFDHDYDIAKKIYTSNINLGKSKSFDNTFFETVKVQCVYSLFSSLSAIYKNRKYSIQERNVAINQIKGFIVKENLIDIVKQSTNKRIRLLSLPTSIIDFIFYLRNKISK